MESGCLRAGFHGDGGVLMFGEVFESWVPRSSWSLDVVPRSRWVSLVEGRDPNQVGPAPLGLFQPFEDGWRKLV